jgi:hypothetical protein
VYDLIPYWYYIHVENLLVARVAERPHVLCVAVVRILSIGIGDVEETIAGTRLLSVLERIVPSAQAKGRNHVKASSPLRSVRDRHLKLAIAVVM